MAKHISHEALDRLINESLAMEAEAAKDAGALGFMARALVQATLPHSKAEGNEFTRTNGLFTLSLLSPSAIGLPYGSIPRLLLSWITTEADRTKQRELVLGDSLSGFMSELEMLPTGGRWGSITRLKEQMKRLFASSVSCTYDNGDTWALEAVKPVDSARLWWSPKAPAQAGLWLSTNTLGERFFNEIIERPVPFDMRALKSLKKSPLALDTYLWLTYRMFYLRQPVSIPWVALQGQFGADYKVPRQFKAAFLRELKKVLVVYPRELFLKNAVVRTCPRNYIKQITCISVRILGRCCKRFGHFKFTNFYLLFSNFVVSIPFMSNHKQRDSSPIKIGIAR